jgi:integrase
VTSERRDKGLGGLYQRHDHPSCPPPVDGERPPHRCRGRWVGTVEVIIEGKRKRKTVYGRTQKTAQVALAKARRAKEDGTLILTTTTVEQWLNHWLEQVAGPRLKPQTIRGYRGYLDHELIPALGTKRLTDLRPEHIRRLHADMRARGLSEATLRQAHAILRRALRDAMNDDKIPNNPAARVDAPKTKKNRRPSFTVEQARTALRCAGDDPRWWLALFYGMRQGEVLGLNWADVDFDRHSITIRQTRQTGLDGKAFMGDPKSDASHRMLPMLPQVELRLALHWEAEGEPETGLVFHNAGRPIQPKKDWNAWRALIDRATSPPLAPLPYIALHAARNTAASLLEAADVPDRMVAQILGHSQVQITHGYQTAEMARVGAALGSAEALLDLPGPSRGTLPSSP